MEHKIKNFISPSDYYFKFFVNILAINVLEKHWILLLLLKSVTTIGTM